MTVIPAFLKTLCSRRAVLALGISVLLAPLSGGAQVLTVGVQQPITPVADTNHVLVTAPYCSTLAQPFSIFDITTGSPVSFSNLSTLVNNSVCQEISIAISPTTFGGLPAGTVYAVYQLASTDGGKTADVQIASVPPGGGTATVWTTITGVPAPPASPVLGITFDQVGTFANDMIVTTGTGQVFTIDTAKTVTTHDVVIAGGVGIELESPKVAPKDFSTTYGGYLFATGEDPSALYAIEPGSFKATALPAGPALSPRPEAVAFTSSPACSVKVGPNAVSATLIDAVYGNNVVDFFNPTTANAGYINSEFSVAVAGPYNGQYTLNTIGSDGSLGSQLASLGTQQEHLSTVTCLAPAPPSEPGRMTGGGSFFTPDGTRVTHGLELHCTVPSHPNTLEINWGGGNNFHLDNLTSVTCFLDPAISQGHPNADFNTMIGSGTGTLNGNPATIEFEFTDAGEPGVNDQASINIHSGTTTFFVPLTVLDNGNQQAHK